MTYGGELFMRDDPQTLSRRLAGFVRPIPAKVLAHKLGCTERTAENIRRGHWPIARHWVGLVRIFGRDVTEAVFHPEAAAERLAKEVADLEAQLDARRARLRMVSEEAAGAGSGLAPVPRRRAAD